MSPKYQMSLIEAIYEAIYKEYSSYEKVEYYIKKWQYYDGNDYNFALRYKKNSSNLDLRKTLNEIDEETLIKIAIDMGVDTPDFIPSIPTFRNTIKEEYPTASAAFERAYKIIETEPDTAVGLANSALESIIKEILKDDRIKTRIKKSDTLYKLTSEILKVFKMFPESDLPEETKTLGSGLLSVSQAIEDLRSDKTNFHGHVSDDYIIKEPLYVYLVINSICSVAMFLDSFYKTKYPPIVDRFEDNDDLPF